MNGDALRLELLCKYITTKPVMTKEIYFQGLKLDTDTKDFNSQ